MKLEAGYFVIELDGQLIPARFDGEIFHHEKGMSHPHPDHKNVKSVLPLACPLGCRCITNPDGSITVDCTKE